MKKLLKILFCIIIVIAIAIIVVAALLITPREHIMFTPESIEEDNVLSGQMMDTIADSLVTEDGDIVEEAVIAIPPEQFNALLRAAVFASDFHRAPNDYYLRVVSADGSIQAAYYYDLPTGGNIQLIAYVLPMMRDGKLAIDVKKLKIGHISTSGAAIEQYSGEELKKFNDSENGKLFSAAVKDIAISNDGTVTLRLNPVEFSKLVLMLTNDND